MSRGFELVSRGSEAFVVSHEDLAKAREFFRRHEGEQFVPSFVAKTCGLAPSTTLAALCILLEDGHISAHIRGLEWTFAARARR